MLWWIAGLDTLVALVSVGFAVAALIRPASMRSEGSRADRFYPAMYAGRAIPLGLAVAVGVWLTPTAQTALLLGVAMLAQVCDAVIGGRRRLPGMVIGAVAAALIHAAGVAPLV